MLTSRVSEPSTSDPEPEDIFDSALNALFTDDTRNLHGNPGDSINYRSPLFGDLILHVPTHPDAEEGRLLFAHYLWNSAMIAAEAIESASNNSEVCSGSLNRSTGDDGDGDNSNDDDNDDLRTEWNRNYWSIRNKHILELGAGVALPSLISALSGAKSCTITDHPSSPALTSGAIAANVRANLCNQQKSTDGTETMKTSGSETKWKTTTEVSIHGYRWGTTTFYSTSDPTSIGIIQPPQRSFHRIIIADCLWMQAQHVNIIKTILSYLDTTEDPNSCALVVAGFHTGRAIVAEFFDIATEIPPNGWQTQTQTQTPSPNLQEGKEDGLVAYEEEVREVQGKLQLAEIFEINIDLIRRPWKKTRPEENREQAKRWCVCAALTRR